MLLSLGKHGQEKPGRLNLRRLRSSRLDTTACNPSDMVWLWSGHKLWSRGSGTSAKTAKFPKCLRRVFSGLRMSVPKQSLARGETLFRHFPRCEAGFAPVRKTLWGLLGGEHPKWLLALSVSTFGHFGCFDTCTRVAESQGMRAYPPSLFAVLDPTHPPEPSQTLLVCSLPLASHARSGGTSMASMTLCHYGCPQNFGWRLPMPAKPAGATGWTERASDCGMETLTDFDRCC